MPDRPPPYALVARVYNTNLRPFVIAMTLLISIWSIASAVENFKDIADEKHGNFARLATFSTILGILYIIAGAAELFGTVAAVTQRLALIRIFSFAHVGATLIIVAASLMRVILHFLLKNDLLNDCQLEATGQKVDFTWGIWGPHITETLTPEEAKNWCASAYSHDSWSEILLLVATILILGLFTTTVWAYASRNTSGTFAPPSSQPPNPYYQPSFPGAGPATDYAPPPGPPPARGQYARAPPPGASVDELPGYGVGTGYDPKALADAAAAADGKDRKDDSDEDPFADFERRH